MDPAAKPPGKYRSTSSPLLFYIMVGLIVAAILAFLILRPNPSGVAPNRNSTNPPSQQ